MEAIDQRHLRISVEFGIAQLGLMPQVYGRNMQILAFVYVLVQFPALRVRQAFGGNADGCEIYSVALVLRRLGVPRSIRHCL